MRIVVIGVSSSGKTTIGRAVADRLGVRFLDADDFHPAANVEKMSAGQPLDDGDRWPWLTRLRDELQGEPAAVLACSALKRSYRDVLREAGDVQFVFLDLDADTARRRAAGRDDHFMKVDMIASQFEALERPAPDETDVITTDARDEIDELVDEIVARLG